MVNIVSCCLLHLWSCNCWSSHALSVCLGASFLCSSDAQLRGRQTPPSSVTGQSNYGQVGLPDGISISEMFKICVLKSKVFKSDVIHSKTHCVPGCRVLPLTKFNSTGSMPLTIYTGRVASRIASCVKSCGGTLSVIRVAAASQLVVIQ